MEEIRLVWPNGGMGNTVYCLLHLCTNELYKESNSYFIDKLPKNGTHWHEISDQLFDKNSFVIRDHTGYNSKNRLLIGSSNRYFIQLLSWHKWHGIPTVNYGEQLELLVKYLNEFQPPGGTEIDFEIMDFFSNRDNVKKIIHKLGLTINNNFNRLIDSIVANNQQYYNEIVMLEEIANASLKQVDKHINLLPYQQAIIMSMIETTIKKPFRLVHNSFKNTNTVLSFLENNI